MIQSLKRAVLRHGWAFDDRFNRIGSPFAWIDGESMPDDTKLAGIYGVLQVLSMYYERYPTPREIATDDHETARAEIEAALAGLVAFYFPFLSHDARVRENIECTALVRAQDYSAIRTFCDGIPGRPRHLDIGPGLGVHAIYSLGVLNGTYIGVEAHARFYEIQRHAYRVFAGDHGAYFDAVAAETMGMPADDIRACVADGGAIRLYHVPSWHFEWVGAESIDLVTATWVLNEVAPAGIAWLLANVTRVLKPGGHLYIRDSRRPKPGRHALDYDRALVDLGFAPSGAIEAQNRIDFHGLPRAYRKADARSFDFEQAFERLFGRAAVTVHTGAGRTSP